MRQDQEVILAKLSRYLELKLQEMKKIQPRDTALEMDVWTRAQTLRNGPGCCYGFSIIHSSMELVGKKDWWYSVCAVIASWDGQPKSLGKLYSLPQSEDTKPVSLEQLFDRAISYIVFNQANNPKSNADGPSAPLSPVKQRDFLGPNEHFELLVGNLTFRVSDREKIIDYFKHDELVDFLNQPKTKFNVANRLCLISSRDHSCSLSYGQHNNQSGWFYYDPNYKNGKAKFFTDAHKLVTEIQKTLGEQNELEIELAQLSPTAVKSLKLYTDEKIPQKKTEVSVDQGSQTSQELEDKKPFPQPPAKDIKTAPEPTYVTVMKLPKSQPPTPVLSTPVEIKINKPAQSSGGSKVGAGDCIILDQMLRMKNGKEKCMEYIKNKYSTSEDIQSLIKSAEKMGNTRLKELVTNNYIPDQDRSNNSTASYGRSV